MLDAEIKLIQDSLTSLYEWGSMLASLGAEFPDFTPRPTADEMHELIGITRTPQETQRLSPAQQQTDARTKAFTDARHAAVKAAETKEPAK